LAEPHPLEEPRDRGIAHLDPTDRPKELAPLGEGGGRALLEVGLQQLPGVLADLGLGAGPPLLGGERAPLVGHLGVSLDRGERYAENTSSLALAHAPTQGLDYLLAQVF
jgi:hypothetical protein